MKTNTIIIICLLFLIIILITYVLITHNNNAISNIKEMRFTYTTGNYVNANVLYEIKCHNNNCTATIKPSGIPEEESIKKEINKNIMNKIEKLLNKYKISKWNNFDKSDKNVLDGNSFYISITMENNKTITANGYMKWPKNYAKVKNELDEMFNKIYND